MPSQNCCHRGYSRQNNAQTEKNQQVCAKGSVRLTGTAVCHVYDLDPPSLFAA